MKEPSFDTWTIIFLFTAVQGLFVATALFFTKKENTANRWLILLIGLMSLTLVGEGANNGLDNPLFGFFLLKNWFTIFYNKNNAFE